MNANAIPWLMLYVKGIVIIAKTAGADSAISFHSISTMFLTNNTATYTKAAPSICLGSDVASGAKNRHERNIRNVIVEKYSRIITR